MIFHKKYILLPIVSAFLLVSCKPQEEAPQAPAQQKKEEHPTTKEKEELEIHEDEVMNPFPG